MLTHRTEPGRDRVRQNLRQREVYKYTDFAAQQALRFVAVSSTGKQNIHGKVYQSAIIPK